MRFKPGFGRLEHEKGVRVSMQKRFGHVKKSLLSLALSLTVLFSVASVSGLQTLAVANNFTSGSGTQSDPYVITTAEQLASLGGQPYTGTYFKLGQDIDLKNFDNSDGHGWTPINYFNESDENNIGFNGTFDGNGHKILNLTINAQDYAPDSCLGLFAVIDVDGTVKNVGIENAAITTSDSSDLYYCIGGIAGMNNGTISSCYADVNLTGVGGSDVGGLVGDNYSTIINCYVQGTVDAAAAATEGFISCAGGVAGYNASEITNCYSLANVKVNGTKYYAGIAVSDSVFDQQPQSADSPDQVTSCYFLAGGSLTDSAGTSVSADKLKTLSTFSGWDFSGVWQLNSASNGGYPFLKVFASPLTIHVKNASGNVSGASVTVGSAAVHTDASGNAVFTLLPGSYSFQVSGTGFTAVSDSAALASGGTVKEITVAAAAPATSSKPATSTPAASTPASSKAGNPDTGSNGSVPAAAAVLVLCGIAAAALPLKKLAKSK